MNRIRDARKRAGIKQTDLCQRLGISQGALSGWENGKFEPGQSSWLQLSEILSVSVDYLMGGSCSASLSSSGLSHADADLLHKFHALNPQAQARILNSLDFEYRAVEKEPAKLSTSLA